MTAVWVLDYDYRTDKTYNRPGCPDCNAPVLKFEDGKYHCLSCDRVAELEDPKMVEWLDEREETKIEMWDCTQFKTKHGTVGCGGKECVEAHFVRNAVTLEWEMGWSVCRNCGQRTIV